MLVFVMVFIFLKNRNENRNDLVSANGGLVVCDVFLQRIKNSLKCYFREFCLVLSEISRLVSDLSVNLLQLFSNQFIEDLNKLYQLKEVINYDIIMSECPLLLSSM